MINNAEGTRQNDFVTLGEKGLNVLKKRG